MRNKIICGILSGLMIAVGIPAIQACKPSANVATHSEDAAKSIQRTYIMLKPDCVEKKLIGEVISRIEKKGYRIVNMQMKCLDERIVREHYAHIQECSFFPETLAFMTSGPVVCMIVEGENAVLGMRELMGSTNPKNAAEGTIRKDFAENAGRNVIHGSDSVENAEIEIRRFFGK